MQPSKSIASANKNNYGDKWVNQAHLLDRISKQSHAAFCLWDIRKRQFVFFNDQWNLLGLKGSPVITQENGVSIFLSRIGPGYVKAIHLMYHKCLDFGTIHLSELAETVFQFDLPYQKNELENIQLMVQAIAVESNHTGPVLFLNSMHDVTHLKKEKTATLAITSSFTTEIWSYRFDNKILEKATHLSPQEKKVLTLLSQRKGSKEIASILHTSPHTIDTQRRSLLHKTNCTDSTALVSYAQMTGII